MQTITHPFLSSTGSVNYKAADEAARDARSDALRAFAAGFVHTARRCFHELASVARHYAHAE